MNPVIKEIRKQQAFEQPRQGNHLRFAAGVLAAFIVGAGGSLLFFSPRWDLPDLQLINVVSKPVPASVAAGPRVGRAETAPLLRACVPRDQFSLDPDQALSAGDLYRIMQEGNKISRVTTLLGIKDMSLDSIGMTEMWAQLADCVYRQNGWALCDIDNRALAVVAATTLVRQVAVMPTQRAREAALHKTFADVRAELGERSPRPKPRPEDRFQSARNVKDRVLSALRGRAAEGRLEASDFGALAPVEIKTILREVKAAGDACAGAN